LRENILPLQFQDLKLPISRGTFHFGSAPGFFAYVPVAGIRSGAFQGVCHLILHRFTFPSTGHIFILRVLRLFASRRMAKIEIKRERGSNARLAGFRVWH
jgi:hypothetical protein